ncbi:translation initiation factor IF-2-like [Panicum virgatum]|uniref:translation initiation factor IF-2-like n=1 Tax=Panicum virgatum TaxID=38727 RepID=UPI0019D586F3|nr:translation initiation factor IF-2-like [Panicum virgatum]
MVLGERGLAPATLVVAPAARAERRSSTPTAGQRSPASAAGRDSPASAASTGSGASVVSVETPVRTAPRLQVDPRATPSGQSSLGVSVPRARRSGTGKRSLSSPAEATTKSATCLAPTKALKTGARATPHSAPLPPIRGDQALEAGAVKLRETMARGAQEAQLARAQEGGGDAGQSGAAAATRVDADKEAGRGDAGSAARPDVEAGEGGADGAALLEVGGGTGRDAQEHPASREQEETPAPEPPRAGVEGATAVASVPTALVVEETRISGPARAGDEGAAVAATAQMAPENVAPVVELPQTSEEYRDSRDIDTAAATSAADRIFEFISASEDILGAGTFDGLSHGADWAVVQSGVPSNFVRIERGEDDAWRARVIPSDFTHTEREESDA